MGSHRLQTVNKRGNYNLVITCSQTKMFSPYVNKSIFTHGNKVYMIAKKKVYLIELLRNTGFGKIICIIQTYNQLTE